VKILLDIDGVLVTTPSWRNVERHEDGFVEFNDTAKQNLAVLIEKTQAEIVLTTTHRISYSEKKWVEIFNARGIHVTTLTKVNQASSIQDIRDRGNEILDWIDKLASNERYVIIDDDPSINKLPNRIKKNWVKTQSHLGFDKHSLDLAVRILLGN
jgi:sugar-specific transcriptional regulator TrmB